MTLDDSTLTCLECLRRERTRFGHNLAHGWPTCCGATMRVEVDSTDVIDAAVREALLAVEVVVAIAAEHGLET